jgi:ribosome recycling factor
MSSEYTKNLEIESKTTIEHFKKELSKVRTGRASSGLLHGIHVDYYGASTPLEQLGLINTPEPRLITVQVYDASSIDAVEKAIKQSELGLNPSREGNIIRIFIPPLNEERRKEIIKKLHKTTEETKVILRGHRREAIDAIKKGEKDKELSEDEARKAQEDVQKVLDKYVAEADKILTVKEKEIMEV